MGHIGKSNGNGMSDSRPSLNVEALDLDWKLIRLHLCLVGLVGHKGRFSVTPAHSSSHPKTSSFPDAGLCQQCHANSCICIYICICVFLSTPVKLTHFTHPCAHWIKTGLSDVPSMSCSTTMLWLAKVVLMSPSAHSPPYHQSPPHLPTHLPLHFPDYDQVPPTL